MVVGLVIVLANLTENKKTSLMVKCFGPGLVMVGLTAMLVRILFVYTPYTCRKQGESKKHKGKGETKKGALNHGADVSNEELYVNDMVAKRDNMSSRKPTKQRFPPKVDLNNGTLSNDCSSMWSVELDNVKKKKQQKRQDEKKEEIGKDGSNSSLANLNRAFFPDQNFENANTTKFLEELQSRGLAVGVNPSLD